MIKVEVRCEALTRAVIEIILGIKSILWVILLTKILHALRLADGVILACNMIRHKVNDNLHACLMSALNESLKL